MSEASSVRILREFQEKQNSLSSLPEIKSGLGSINILILCEENERLHRCANWSLDLKNKILIENDLHDEVNASAVVTAKDEIFMDILKDRLDIGPAITFGDVLYEGDRALKENLYEALSAFHQK